MTARARALRCVLPLACAGVALTACDADPVAPDDVRRDTNAGQWTTWVLPSGASIRPPPPPATGSAAEAAEIETILRIQQDGLVPPGAMAQWDGPPTGEWTRIAIERIDFWWPLLPDVRTVTPVRSARILALLHVAIYDAMVATWAAKYAFDRPPPYRADTRIGRALAYDIPSYPSEHAAAATAAAAVLAYAFPLDDAAAFAALARTAADSRVAAGVAWPSDIAAGEAIGREVAHRVIARATQDGSDSEWSGGLPVSPDRWRPTPPRRVMSPYDPMAGGWKTWVLRAGDEFRLPDPPLPGSVAFDTDLAELRRLSTERTAAQADVARYWATGAPPIRWTLDLEDEIGRRRLTPMRAARAHALVSVTQFDALVACWDSKYAHWLARPITVDSTIVTVVSTPPFPSYPSGHSTQSVATAVVMGYLFPDRAGHYLDRAFEASISRVWGGIHYRFDVHDGDALGDEVGRSVIRRARQDGSTS